MCKGLFTVTGTQDKLMWILHGEMEGNEEVQILLGGVVMTGKEEDKI